MKSTFYFVVATLVQCAFSSPLFYYGEMSQEDVKRLKSWTPENLEPMWQMSGQFQGDIILDPEDILLLEKEERNGLINTKKRWANREIPYDLSDNFTSSEKKFIDNALAKEFARTCITVRPKKSTDTDYVFVTGEDTGCKSKVGRSGGRQDLNLQRNGCIWYGTIVHEFLHAAGFYHQQSATERDDYVDIITENIKAGKEHNFNKYPATLITSFGEEYDYGSIMHYNKYAFSSNGKPTIVPTKDPNAAIGQRNGLSSTDIAKLNKMYNCP